MNALRWTPLGGTPGGAFAALLEVAGLRVLLDAGIAPPAAPGTTRTPDGDTGGPGVVAVLLTSAQPEVLHALPAVLGQWPQSRTYASAITAAVGQTWLDAVSHRPDPDWPEPPSGVAVRRVADAWTTIRWGVPVIVAANATVDVWATWWPTDVVPGSAMIGVDVVWRESGHVARLVYAHDLVLTGPAARPSRVPAILAGFDPDLVCLGGAGDAPTSDLEAVVAQVVHAVARGGNVLLPIRAFGTGQALLGALRQARVTGQLRDTDVVVDGLSRAMVQVCETFRYDRPAETADATEAPETPSDFWAPALGVRPVRGAADRARLLRAPRGVIVLAPSATRPAGPSAAFWHAWRADARHTILVDRTITATAMDREAPDAGHSASAWGPGEAGGMVYATYRGGVRGTATDLDMVMAATPHARLVLMQGPPQGLAGAVSHLNRAATIAGRAARAAVAHRGEAIEVRARPPRVAATPVARGSMPTWRPTHWWTLTGRALWDYWAVAPVTPWLSTWLSRGPLHASRARDLMYPVMAGPGSGIGTMGDTIVGSLAIAEGDPAWWQELPAEPDSLWRAQLVGPVTVREAHARTRTMRHHLHDARLVHYDRSAAQRRAAMAQLALWRVRSGDLVLTRWRLEETAWLVPAILRTVQPGGCRALLPAGFGEEVQPQQIVVRIGHWPGAGVGDLDATDLRAMGAVWTALTACPIALQGTVAPSWTAPSTAHQGVRQQWEVAIRLQQVPVEATPMVETLLTGPVGVGQPTWWDLRTGARIGGVPSGVAPSVLTWLADIGVLTWEALGDGRVALHPTALWRHAVRAEGLTGATAPLLGATVLQYLAAAWPPIVARTRATLGSPETA